MTLETKVDTKTLETMIDTMTHVNTLEYTPLITAVIAFLGVTLMAWINWCINKKQFNGLVVSQSRINWIQDVRKIAAQYLTNMISVKMIIQEIEKNREDVKNFRAMKETNVTMRHHEEAEEYIELEEDSPDLEHEEINSYCNSKIKENNIKIEKKLEKLAIELDKVTGTTQLLRLYLPKEDKDKISNEEHKNLQKLMDDIQDIIDSAYKKEEILNSNNYIDKLDEFTNEISAYLKQEWDVAKKNK